MIALRPLAWFGICFAAGVVTARLAGGLLLPFLLTISALLIAVPVLLLRAGGSPPDLSEEPKSPDRKDGIPAPAVRPDHRPRTSSSSSQESSEQALAENPLAAGAGRITRFGPERILILAGVVLFALGSVRQEWADRARESSQALIPKWFDATVIIEAPPDEAYDAVLSEEESPAPTYWSTTARIVRIDGVAVPPVRVWAGAWGRPDVRRGLALTARVRREETPPAAWPGAFSWARFLESRQAAARVRLVSYDSAGKEDAAGAAGPVPRFFRLLDRIRAAGIRRSRALFGGAAGEVTAAVLYGHRAGLPEEVRSHFRRVGIAHVLAISGLHVGLLAALSWGVLRPIARERRLVAAATLGVLLLYLALAGGRTAAARATIMAGLYLGGILLARRSDLLNALGGAALILLWINPAGVANLGFQLSFTAVIFISCLFHEVGRCLPSSPRGRRDLPATRPDAPGRGGLPFGGAGGRGGSAGAGSGAPWIRRIRKDAGALLILSVAAWLGVSPLVAHAFHLVSPVGMLVNLVVLPLMSLVLAAGVAAQALVCLPAWLSAVPAALLALPARALLLIADLSEGLPSGWSTTPPPDARAMGLYYAGFGLLFTRAVLARRAGAFRRGLVLLSGVLILSGTGWMIWSTSPAEAPAGVRITLLPEARGETALVETPEGRIAVIGRLPRRGLDAAEYLRYRRRRGPDLVVHLTDRDPAEGLSALLEGGPVPRIVGLRESAPDEPPTEAQTEAGTAAPLAVEGRGGGAERLPDARGWRRVTETGPPLRMAVSRDREGTLAWWAVRAGDGPAATVSTRLRPEPLACALRRAVPGAGADLLVLRVQGALPAASLPGTDPARIALAEGRIEGMRVLDRSAWGALVLDESGGRLRRLGYDGEAWREIPPPESAAPSEPPASSIPEAFQP